MGNRRHMLDQERQLRDALRRRLADKGELASFNCIHELWNVLPDAAEWPDVRVISQCAEQPDIALIFGVNELYAVVDRIQRRVLTEDEFPSESIEGLHWLEVK